MMTQQVQSKANAGKTGAPGNPAIQKQIRKATATIAAASGAVLNANTEFAFAHQWGKTQTLHESAHGAEPIAEQSDATIDHEAVDAVRSHAATDTGLGFQHQWIKSTILETQCCSKSGDASTDDDDVRVSALAAHSVAP